MLGRPLLVAMALIALPFHAAAAVDGVDAQPAAPCVVKGTLVENATIYDSPKGGQPVADIIGTQRWVQVSDFLPRAQRLRIVSGKSTPSLRVEGFVDVGSMPIGATKDLSIAGHVLAIRATVPLRIVEENGVMIAEPRSATFDAIESRVACGELHVAREKAQPALPPGGSLLIPLQKSVDLFGGPGGTALTTLHLNRAPSTVELHGYETQNGYVHVRFAGDVLIDGWMRRVELTEKMSIGIGCIGTIGGLGMWGTSASPSYAQRDTEVRLGATGPRVGVLEKGARVVRWGGGSGVWTQIRIYDADANEPAGKSFFVREDDLGNAMP